MWLKGWKVEIILSLFLILSSRMNHCWIITLNLTAFRDSFTTKTFDYKILIFINLFFLSAGLEMRIINTTTCTRVQYHKYFFTESTYMGFVELYFTNTFKFEYRTFPVVEYLYNLLLNSLTTSFTTSMIQRMVSITVHRLKDRVCDSPAAGLWISWIKFFLVITIRLKLCTENKLYMQMTTAWCCDDVYLSKTDVLILKLSPHIVDVEWLQQAQCVLWDDSMARVAWPTNL